MRNYRGFKTNYVGNPYTKTKILHHADEKIEEAEKLPNDLDLLGCM